MKRFTASEKWDKEWFLSLEPRLKCLWFYLCDKCDHAGVWDTNWALASYMIGGKVSEADVATFSGRLVKLSCGKFYISNFIEFQYGEVSETCPAHKPVLKSIEKHFVTLQDKGYLKGIIKGIHTLQDKDKDKDSIKEGVQGEIPTVEEVIEFGSMGAAIPPSFCRHYHEEKTIKVTWLNQYGRPVDWRKEIVKWWARSRYTWQEQTKPKITDSVI